MDISRIKNLICSNKFAEWTAVFFVFFFGLLIIFWPILGGQKIFNDYYITNYAVGQTGYNFYKDFGSSLREGHLQLWWSNYMAGYPAYLTHTSFFHPLGLLLFRFFDYILAYNWLAFLNFLFAALSMYWFVRNLKLSRPAAILAGFAWTLSLNNIHYGSMPGFNGLYAFIPLFFGAILKISEWNKKYLILGSLIAGLGFIAGLTNIVFYTFIAGLAWALFLDYPRFFGKTLRGYVFISFVGTILASFWLFPVLNYLPFTLRSEAVSSTIFYDYLKSGDILRFFYPFIGLPGFGGISLLSGLANLYIGIVPLLLAIIAMFLWQKNKFIAFWFGLFIFAISMRLRFFPIFQWTQYLPVFNRFRGPFHWYSLAIFSLPVLRAYGLDLLKEIKNFRWFNIFIKIIGWFAAINIFAALIVNLAVKIFRSDILKIVFGYFDLRLYSTAKKYPIDYYHQVIAQVFDKSAATLSFLNYQFLI